MSNCPTSRQEDSEPWGPEVWKSVFSTVNRWENGGAENAEKADKIISPDNLGTHILMNAIEEPEAWSPEVYRVAFADLGKWLKEKENADKENEEEEGGFVDIAEDPDYQAMKDFEWI